MDFTLKKYKNLLNTLKTRCFAFYTFSGYLQREKTNEPKQQVILRHDVDLLPENALQTAKIENNLGIRSTYYFRIIPEVFQPEVIQQIEGLGHEVGYHYEDLRLAAEEDLSSELGVVSEENVSSKKYVVGSEEVRDQRSEISSQIKEGKGQRDEKTGTGAVDIPFRDSRVREGKEKILDRAYELFRHHLSQIRQYADVQTICMHGNPKSRYDSKDIWKKYNYRDLGILGEPYFDIDFSEVFYLTDTGRRWDGWKVSLRDKVPEQQKWIEQGLVFHATRDIIQAAQNNQLPDKIMITTHPQRWTDKPLPWVKELVWQNTKNVAKYFLVKLRSNS